MTLAPREHRVAGPDTMSRRIAIFFYGLFMDADALRSKGVDPTNIRRSTVRGFSIRIGQRAALVPNAGGHICGLVMDLSHEEIDRLYADPTLHVYRPEAVVCELDEGISVPALCFNLPIAPFPHERNPEYASKLKELARRLGLPQSYIDTIGEGSHEGY
jgi:hypothetical protein